MKQRILDIDPSETVELEITRHPAGLIPIYATGSVVALLMLLAPWLLRHFSGAVDMDGIASTPILMIVGVVLAILSLAVTFIGAYVYRQNELVVTNENLIQVLQSNLFHKKISQLSLEKVQDVTATQKGVLQTMLNYGTIFIETAGETANFGFPYARDPHIAAKHINEAHERFLKKYGIDVV